MTTPAAASSDIATVRYAPRGRTRQLFTTHATEVFQTGPAGTGKTRGWLELTHLRAAKYPGSRHLLVRKTLVSLKSSAVVTFNERVQPDRDGVVYRGAGNLPPGYYYPNGSYVGLGGLDNPVKLFSTDYDTIVVFEANELTEGEWESLLRALRHGAMPYQQLGGDCNPDAPTHWIRGRVDGGKATEFVSRHADNPLLYDTKAGEWTPAGRDYMEKLHALSGVRRARLLDGLWVAAEGMVWQDAWDRARNLLDRFPIPPSWPRYLSIDFGYTHPFVCQWWAQDDDGRLYRYRELYRTHTLVEDHARAILAVSHFGQTGGEPLPQAIFCDHDAEGRATLEAHLGMRTTAANKAVQEGIQAVAARLRPAGDTHARLVLLRDALMETDPFLRDAKLPTCTEEEVEGYVWNLASGRTTGEEPVKRDDHGCDTMRYVVASLDLAPRGVEYAPSPW